MTQNVTDHAQSRELDTRFGITGDPGAYFSQAALEGNGRKYSPWYAHLLSTLVVAAAGEKIVFARGKFVDDARDIVEVHVVTSARVIFSRIDLVREAKTLPQAHVIPRSNLQALCVSVGARIDEDSSLGTGWPGKISFEATFRGLDAPLVAEGDAYTHPGTQVPSSTYELLQGLQADLTKE
ncbi:hypothetical protein [Frigoribacterium sp. CFBP 8751]|uniref:hypothetical protein n=1 Tax=Frigoribacterium sp. CFBP 8751 TaxID=2775277 RepID=UPI0017860A30|nr:hypothetical protein [Frigoribacterium sp. CFBP 8751]MBD8537663.1 hypothetical protein [Frigoribacterium sp. CFBP 8751]